MTSEEGSFARYPTIRTHAHRSRGGHRA